MLIIDLTFAIDIRFSIIQWVLLQLTYLDVLEPPDIIDAQTPAELRVRENEALKLTCQARGHPHPRITWKREDGHDLNLNHREAGILYLSISNVEYMMKL